MLQVLDQSEMLSVTSPTQKSLLEGTTEIMSTDLNLDPHALWWKCTEKVPDP